MFKGIRLQSRNRIGRRKGVNMNTVLVIIAFTAYQALGTGAIDEHKKPTQNLKPALVDEARKEVFRNTKMALEGFYDFMKDTFGDYKSRPDEPKHESNEPKYNVDQATEDKLSANDEIDWTVLDQLPECTNQTNSNKTLCIEKDSKSKITTKNETAEAKSNPYKRKHRTMRSSIREGLKEGYFRVRNFEQTQKMLTWPKEKLYNWARKKNLPLNWGANVNNNRLAGGPFQQTAIMTRMNEFINRKYYRELNFYFDCSKDKRKWHREPWKGLKLFYRKAGQNIKLSCNICKRPDETAEDLELKWRRRQSIKPEIEDLDVASFSDENQEGNRFSWRPGGVLHISDLQVDDTGQYICLMDHEYEAVHILEVVAKEPTNKVVGHALKKEGKGVLPAGKKDLKKYNLRLKTEWRPFTKCSRCNARGKRRRFGFCIIQKINATAPVKPKDAEVFNYFPHGLGCRSKFLPKYIKNLKEVKARKSEFQTEYCWEKCPAPPKKKVIRDEEDRKMEIFQSTMGFKKFKKKIDKFPKVVRRKTIYVPEGGNAEVRCIKRIKPIQAVRWQKDYKTLDPVELPKVTHKRMVITDEHTLLISDALKSDHAIYSCWVDGALRKATKVKIYKRQQTGIKDKLVYVGVGLCLLTIVMLLLNIGKNKRKGRKQVPVKADK